MDENMKIIVKSIVYCPYKDCLNFNNPGVNNSIFLVYDLLN